MVDDTSGTVVWEGWEPGWVDGPEVGVTLASCLCAALQLVPLLGSERRLAVETSLVVRSAAGSLIRREGKAAASSGALMKLDQWAAGREMSRDRKATALVLALRLTGRTRTTMPPVVQR
jgi:hypothetical protein